jgi:glycosyltransferase involved in cell wall biosynthesis
MRVLAWSAMPYVKGYVTGVGKHIIHMINGLARRPGWHVHQLVTTDRPNGLEKNSVDRSNIPPIKIPMNRRVAEFLWRSFDRPRVDFWCRDLDWVYCPRELYIPVSKLRSAVTVHDLYHLEPQYSDGEYRSRFRWLRTFQRALDQATVVLSVSEFTKQRLVELLQISPEKISVIGNGVEQEFFDIFDEDPKATSLLNGSRYFLSVGGLTQKKGGDDLLAFAEVLQRKEPGLELVVTGPVEPRFSGMLTSLSNVRLVPRGLDSAEMCKLTRGALSALVLSEYEGFGIPILEAMAAGVPVVAARRSALPEVVGEAGMLVDPKSPTVVCDLALSLAYDEGMRNEMIAKGRERAKQFPWSACVGKLASILEEIGPSGTK